MSNITEIFKDKALEFTSLEKEHKTDGVSMFLLVAVNSLPREMLTFIHTLEPRLCSQYTQQTTGWTNEELSCDLWRRQEIILYPRATRVALLQLVF
jgi:hypothetical protein